MINLKLITESWYCTHLARPSFLVTDSTNSSDGHSKTAEKIKANLFYFFIFFYIQHPTAQAPITGRIQILILNIIKTENLTMN